MVQLYQDKSIDKYDFRNAFPQLSCLSWYRHRESVVLGGEDEYTLHVELYKPVTIYDLICQGTPEEWFEDPSRADYYIKVLLLDLLDSSTIKKGGALLPDPQIYIDLSQDVQPFCYIEPDIKLRIEAEVPDDGIVATFQVVLDIVAAATGMSDRQKLLHCQPMSLTCYPSVLEAFINVVSPKVCPDFEFQDLTGLRTAGY